MSVNIALVQFLGSNCDADCLDAFQKHFGIGLKTIWHSETKLPKLDAVILPGGFSYGDFLRSGALAAHAPILQEIKTFVKRGGAVLGICNGFQILTESHILPGALLKNDHGKFICDYVSLDTEVDGASGYHERLGGKKFRIPIAHGEGRYFAEREALKKLNAQGQILFRYASDQPNPNGSLENIAGIVSENGRVLGLMPHPERACDKILGGSDDGLKILECFLEACL